MGQRFGESLTPMVSIHQHMQPALTGGAVIISGGYHDDGKGSYYFLY